MKLKGLRFSKGLNDLMLGPNMKCKGFTRVRVFHRIMQVKLETNLENLKGKNNNMELYHAGEKNILVVPTQYMGQTR